VLNKIVYSRLNSAVVFSRDNIRQNIVKQAAVFRRTADQNTGTGMERGGDPDLEEG
jgi:hypothetical protein